MRIARHARRSKSPLVTDPLWTDISREVRYASELVRAHEERGLSRELAGWVAEGHMRAAVGHLQQITERHAARARTALGRALLRRRTGAVGRELGEGLWFTQRMQRHNVELFLPPRVFFRYPLRASVQAPVPVAGPRSPRVSWAHAA